MHQKKVKNQSKVIAQQKLKAIKRKAIATQIINTVEAMERKIETIEIFKPYMQTNYDN